MPDESSRAVAQTREFLAELSRDSPLPIFCLNLATPLLPQEVQQQGIRVQRLSIALPGGQELQTGMGSGLHHVVRIRVHCHA